MTISLGDPHLATYTAARGAARAFVTKHPLQSDTPGAHDRIFIHAVMDLLTALGASRAVLDALTDDWVDAVGAAQKRGWDQGYDRGYARGKETVQPPF
jgi:hypothetical protein